MIGQHKCRRAHNTGFKEAISIGLEEAFTALEESFYDLSDEQMQAFLIAGRNNIAWIVMHTLQNLDEYTNLAHGGQPAFKREERWDLWQCRDDERPRPGDPFPAQADMMTWLKSLRETAERTLERMTEADLANKPDDRWPGNVADMYMRTICHTTAHSRQIWLLRGALGLTDGKAWPQQHWA